MRLLLILGLAILVISVTAAKTKKNKKNNDWDDLEDLLKKVDEDKITSREEDESEIEDEDEDELAKDLPTTSTLKRKNPCEDHKCGWGKECVIKKDGKPKCECIRKCPEITDPEPFDKVCSNKNETFESLCHLYQERCRCRRDKEECENSGHKTAHLEYMGECKGLEPCTEEHLKQFPGRMADWLFQVMRDLKKREELHGAEWEKMLEDAEQDDHLKHVYPVIWKFCELDKKPHDKEVTHHELIPITAPVMPMESCIKPFLKSCDTDDSGRISLKEWGKCLGLEEGDIIERC